jgi:hypothetical protein
MFIVDDLNRLFCSRCASNLNCSRCFDKEKRQTAATPANDRLHALHRNTIRLEAR